MRTSKVNVIAVCLPLFFLVGCQNRESTPSVLDHPSFDSAEHFYDFLDQCDLTSLKCLTKENMIRDVQRKNIQTKYRYRESTSVESNESDTYSMVYTNGFTGNSGQTYENRRTYCFMNEKKFFSLSSENTSAPNRIPSDFSGGNNIVKTVKEYASVEEGKECMTREEGESLIKGALQLPKLKESIRKMPSVIFSRTDMVLQSYSSYRLVNNYYVRMNCYSDVAMASYLLSYIFTSDLNLASYTEECKTIRDSFKDWDESSHTVSDYYLDSLLHYSFTYGEKTEVKEPKEKESILSAFGEDALD